MVFEWQNKTKERIVVIVHHCPRDASTKKQAAKPLRGCDDSFAWCSCCMDEVTMFIVHENQPPESSSSIYLLYVLSNTIREVRGADAQLCLIHNFQELVAVCRKEQGSTCPLCGQVFKHEIVLSAQTLVNHTKPWFPDGFYAKMSSEVVRMIDRLDQKQEINRMIQCKQSSVEAIEALQSANSFLRVYPSAARTLMLKTALKNSSTLPHSRSNAFVAEISILTINTSKYIDCDTSYFFAT